MPWIVFCAGFAYNEFRIAGDDMRRKIQKKQRVTDEFLVQESVLETDIPDIFDAESDRKMRLSEKARLCQCSENGAKQPENLVFCEACRKWFRNTAKPGEEVRCPYCGTKFEQASELHVFDPNLSNQDKARLYAKVQEQLLKKEKWEDTRKEQISLEMGSSEYLERVEDLKLHDPFRPDDEMHAVLEEYNEDLVLKGMEKEAENPYASDDDRILEIEQRRNLEREKRSLHAKAVRTAIASAAITETLADDQLARAITTDNELLYDPTVKPRDYVRKLDEYIQDLTCEV